MERGFNATKAVKSGAGQRGLDLWASTQVEHAASQEKHGLNTDVYSMGVVVREIGETINRQAAVGPLVDFALDEDRRSRPSAQEMLDKLRSLSIKEIDNNQARGYF
jgi:hypothetical protein